METELDRIKKLCDEHGITFAQLERELKFSNGYFGKLRKGFLPPDRTEMVARYFNVSTNYLRGSDMSLVSDFVVKDKNEEMLIELFRKEKDDGILHKYIELAKAFKGDK